VSVGMYINEMTYHFEMTYISFKSQWLIEFEVHKYINLWKIMFLFFLIVFLFIMHVLLDIDGGLKD
jgi:hypothetical protein